MDHRGTYFISALLRCSDQHYQSAELLHLPATPSLQASLCEALRQLYVLDALDVDGGITPTGRAMAALPLEPALARALLEAHKLG